MDLYNEEKARNQPVDPKTLVKQQFVMSKANAIPRKDFKLTASVTLLFLPISRQQNAVIGLLDLQFRCSLAHKALSAEN